MYLSIKHPKQPICEDQSDVELCAPLWSSLYKAIESKVLVNDPSSLFLSKQLQIFRTFPLEEEPLNE